jgi:ribose 5-phosphate isomerase RpiB
VVGVVGGVCGGCCGVVCCGGVVCGGVVDCADAAAGSAISAAAAIAVVHRFVENCIAEVLLKLFVCVLSFRKQQGRYHAQLERVLRGIRWKSSEESRNFLLIRAR